MQKTSERRVGLVRAKTMRALQVLDYARHNGCISEKRYQKSRAKCHERLRKIEKISGKTDGNRGMFYSHLDLPREAEKMPASTREASTREASTRAEERHELLGGTFVKILLAILVFFMLGYFVQFASRQPIACVLIALACPLLYLFIAYQFDSKEPEPKLLVLGAFVWGMLAGVLALWLNNFLLGTFDRYWSFSTALAVMVCLAGVTEELTKGIGLFHLSKNPQYNDPIDGILYGIAAGLGFAAFENLSYFAHFSDMLQVGILSETTFSASILLRSTLSALGHACFTGMLSLLLAQAKLKYGCPSVADFLYAYLAAAFLHGIFNGFVQFLPDTAVVLVGIMLVACLYYFWRTVQQSWTSRVWQNYLVKI